MSGAGSRLSLRPSSSTSLLLVVVITVSLLLSGAPGLSGQEPPPPQWQNTAELTFLLTGGNSQASTLGLRNNLRRTSQAGQLRVTASALRTDATRIERFAVETPDGDFEVREDEDTERTAERYSAGIRYDRNLTSAFFSYGSVNWDRNTFAGFDSRTILSGGAGAQRASDRAETKLGVGLTYTFQNDVTPDPDRSDNFVGLRATLDHSRQLTTGTSFELAWVVDANAQEWDDVRGTLEQAVTAALSDRLSLKTSLQLQVDNDPPVQSLRLETADGQDTGERVLAPLRRVDRNLSVALVVTL
ncbi:MAG: DUF481 domain-containing protein [Gemmatimonadales bacterium]|nr:MAG: DUF481 domain-containing protein [Gemmatimonadales bacterium]